MTTANIHASCVLLAEAGRAFDAPDDAGILILGDSGAGKSSTALRLIGRGAKLVADDRVELFLRENILWARPPARTAGLIEAHGLGIVGIRHATEARVALAVRLGADQKRLPEPQFFRPPRPLDIVPLPPLVELSPGNDALVETILLAAAAFAHALFRNESNRN